MRCLEKHFFINMTILVIKQYIDAVIPYISRHPAILLQNVAPQPGMRQALGFLFSKGCAAASRGEDGLSGAHADGPAGAGTLRGRARRAHHGGLHAGDHPGQPARGPAGGCEQR